MYHILSFPEEVDLKPGDHYCALYGTEDEHRELIIPFFQQGLARGEKIIYITDDSTPERILKYLHDEGIQTDQSDGAIKFLMAEETYLSDGVINPERIIDLLGGETSAALEEGFRALRVTGEMTWALNDKVNQEQLIECEAKLNDFFPGSNCNALCQYDTRRFDASVILKVLDTHPLALVGGEAYENIYYIPPEDYLGENPERALLRHRFDILEEGKKASKELRKRTHDLGKRVKELNCLYGIAKLVEKPGITLDEIINGILEIIPPSWQYPEITCARIVLDDEEYKTDNFSDSEWKQTSDIFVHAERVGFVEVCYGEERPESYSGPFMEEEENLINAISERLGRIIQRMRTETEKEILQKRLEVTLTKALSGFIQICSSCKNVRDDKGVWNRVELYINERTEAKFSHGLCPECAEKMYGISLDEPD